MISVEKSLNTELAAKGSTLQRLDVSRCNQCQEQKPHLVPRRRKDKESEVGGGKATELLGRHSPALGKLGRTSGSISVLLPDLALQASGNFICVGCLLDKIGRVQGGMAVDLAAF